MSLPAAAPRNLLHERSISIRAYRRADHLLDVDATVTDVRMHDMRTADRGLIPAGEPLHQMSIRLTVDDAMAIVACAAAIEAGPHAICSSASDNFGRLAGLTIGRGFLKAAQEKVGGAQGCTHLRELLQQIATVVFQAATAKSADSISQSDPRVINTCHAFDSSGPVVKQRWPEFYTGPK